MAELYAFSFFRYCCLGLLGVLVGLLGLDANPLVQEPPTGVAAFRLEQAPIAGRTHAPDKEGVNLQKGL